MPKLVAAAASKPSLLQANCGGLFVGKWPRIPVVPLSHGIVGRSAGRIRSGPYCAADVSPAHLRARAVSIVVSADTIGAVLGPLLTPIVGRASEALGADKLVGLWFANAALFVITLIFVSIFLKPDPREVAREITRHEQGFKQTAHIEHDPGHP